MTKATLIPGNRGKNAWAPWRWEGLAISGALFLSLASSWAQSTVITIGGGNVSPPYSGNANGNTLKAAQFNAPAGLALDPSGTVLFVADNNNSEIRMVTAAGNTASSVTSTFANASNSGSTPVNHPVAVAVDAATNVYVLNYGAGNNGAVLHLGGVGGVATVFAPLATGLSGATAMTLDGLNNIYVTVSGNTVKRVTTNGVVTTVGVINQNGTSLQGIAMEDNGYLALSDSANNGIWLMNPVTGAYSEFTGFHGNADVLGSSSVAAFNAPENLTKAGGGILVVADYGNDKVKLINSSGAVSLLYGVSSSLWYTGSGTWPGWLDGPAGAAQGDAEARLPHGVVVGPDGSVFADEDYYNILRHVTGTGLSAPNASYPETLNGPQGIALDPTGSSVYFTDYGNNAVEVLNLGNNQTTRFLSSGNGISHPVAVMVDTNDYVYVLNQNAGTNGCILQFDPYANFVGTNMAGLNQPTAMTIDGNGNVFVTELGGNVKVLSSGAASLLAAITTNAVTLKTNAQIQGIAVFDDGSLAVSDSGNQVIWTINPITRLITKLTGQLGTSGATLGASNFAMLNHPRQLARAGNNQLVIADYGNNRLVVANRSGAITNALVSNNSFIWLGRPNDPLAGSTVAMAGPVGVAVSVSGVVFDAEPTNQLVRALTTALAVPPQPPPLVDFPYFGTPEGVAYDSVDNFLFIADYARNAVQLLDLNDNSTSTFLSSDYGVTNPVSVLLDTNDNVYVLNQGVNGAGYIQEFDIYGNYYGPIVSGLSQPTSFTMDGYGNLLVTEQSSNIWAFGASIPNMVATITNAHASLQGIALFDDGTIAVSDASNQVIWTVNPLTKVVTQLTGKLGVSGTAIGSTNFAELSQPHQLARAGGNQIVVADSGNNRVVLVQRTGVMITNNATVHLNSLAGDIWFGQNGDPVQSGSPEFLPMVSPLGLALGIGGELFASETSYKDIRGMTGTGLTSPTFNPGVSLPYYANPEGVALNNESTMLYVADPANNSVSSINFANNQTSVFLDSAAPGPINAPVDLAVDSSDNVYVLNQGTGGNGSISEFNQYGNFVGIVAANLAMPTAMKRDFNGNIFVCELNGLVQKFNAAGSNTLANITTNASVRLEGIAVLDNGNVVVSDAGNQVLWKIPGGAVNTNAVLFTGVMGMSGATFGSAGSAKLNQPMRLAQAFGGFLIIADSGNNRVVVADDSGTISEALNSTNATLWFGLPIDPVTPSSPNFVPMLKPVGLAIGPGTSSNGVVYSSENVYKVIRGTISPGIVPPIPPPPAPLNLVASVTYGKITLTWSPAPGATNYYVEHATSSGGPYTLISATGSATTYTDNELGGSTNYYVVVAVNLGGVSPNSAQVVGVPLTPPPPAPEIGWFEYVENNLFQFITLLHPVSQVVFHNDQLLAINPLTNGVSTYYTTDGTEPSATNGSTPPYYADGLGYAQPLPATTTPELIIKAINIDSLGQSSPISTAEFLFQVGNPTIIGNNAAQFTVNDITTNAVLYYTLDGSDPTDGPPSIGPITLGASNSVTLSFVVTSNSLFKISGFRTGYSPSGIAEQGFSPSNFVANTLSFGFASGEASSAFVAAPGQTFYAPVTLSVLSDTLMYSLQFNIVVTNAGPNPGPAITPGAFSFQSMLMKPNPDVPGTYLEIPPFMFIGDDTGPLNPGQIVTYEGTNFVSLLTTDSAINLLGVGWLERYAATNLYVTKSQDLIQYSIAHDDLFSQAGGQVIVGGYAFQVPGTAAINQTYQIQIGSPSATSDGIGAPGSSVYVAAPTNGATAAGPPINALKYVTVGQIPYLAGSVYPFRWFNAGDFGSSNLVNADVEQVFESAIYQVDYPPLGSDFFDAMDSCGGTYVDLGHGYLEFNSYISGPSATSPLFSGDDTSINQIAFGDGVLDVCDVYVTFRRSLDSSLTWFQRYWNNGQRVAQFVPNGVSHASQGGSSTNQAKPKSLNVSTEAPLVNFSGGNIVGSAGHTFNVPINATIVGNYPLRLLMLNLSVEPLDGAPALTTPVTFNQTAGTLGTPYTTSSDANGNFAAVWLNSTNSGLTGTVTLGTLSVPIPATAGSQAAYAIHFDHASASPNGLASFPRNTLTGLLTTSARTNSTYGDGIPDSWRLTWFGTVYNVLSASNACPSGDGVPNWKKFIAGVDPNVANDFPSVHTKTPIPTGSTTAIQWPSVNGIQYIIERASSLYGGPWSILSTNTGTGGQMEYDDGSTANMKFYRVLIKP